MKTKKGYKKIEIDLTDEEFMMLAKEAHRLDITFNALCNKYLEDYISKCEKVLDSDKK